MADVWSGDILLPDGNSIKDVGLASSVVSSRLPLPPHSLRFLSSVDTAKIPLYLAVGPSLSVWTTCQETEAWFEAILLSTSPRPPDVPEDPSSNQWCHLARSQSPIGILAQVESQGDNAQKPRVTEILFYGTIASPAAGNLPTPPSTSPHDCLPELQVHAIPLSSDLLHVQVKEPPFADENRFLPPQHTTSSIPTSPKRARDIFEEATIANKKARRKGGQGVSAAAARGNESQLSYSHRKSLSIDTKGVPFPDFRPPSANSALSRPSARPLSRSPSISSETRPVSQKGIPEAHHKRSNLSRVATISSQPEEPTTESRNKEALSKVVMAAMRMHGLQQRKKHRSRRASVAPGIEENELPVEEAAVDEIAKDEEYKLIYHQTYKGAALALRKHMPEKPLHTQPDRLRDVVEQLLNIFLTDPLTLPLRSDEMMDPLSTPGAKQKSLTVGSTPNHASPFDLPSSARPAIKRSAMNGHHSTGSPMSRKKALHP
ncbi:hypothetical protein IQ07DRAFT_167229 [Pyrenochaeta sp. DS3sAY3a]|nr:hypothetical protein IQ07DRAFT_167229 [Pyrenochaeta sp. DS3sAY3a]